MQEIILESNRVYALDIKNAYQTHWELTRYIIFGSRKYGIFCMEDQEGELNPAAEKLGLGAIRGPLLVAEFEGRTLPDGLYEMVLGLLK